MLDYMGEIIYTFDKVDTMGGGNKTSATPNIIFKVDKDCEKLSYKQDVEFHHLVVNIIFANKRSRTDTCTTTSFKTTIVREYDNED